MTPLVRIRALNKKLNLPHFLIKDESANRYGTWKDRKAKLVLERALDEGVKKLCLITSGNTGYSIASLAGLCGIKVICFVDRNSSKKIKARLRRIAYKVIEFDARKRIVKPEELIKAARSGEREVVWDVTNGYSEAYEPLIDEIAKHKPDYLVCPVGSGEAFVGFYDGIRKRRLKTRLVGVAPRENPSYADKLARIWSPYTVKINRIRRAGHTLLKLSEKDIKASYQEYRGYLRCEPSSCIVWKAIERLNLPRHKNVIVINSGRGLI